MEEDNDDIYDDPSIYNTLLNNVHNSESSSNDIVALPKALLPQLTNDSIT